MRKSQKVAPAVLDAVTDKVLSYRPKSKSKKALRRQKRRAAAKRRQHGTRESSL